jgi:DMSO/TMAO reductase YedYZ molybdopterin-dependent catalytic subunit
MLTAALVAAWYFGWSAGGAPFAPFDLFDWLTRALPGGIITAWIDAAVVIFSTVSAGSTAAAAKHAEQALAIGVSVAGGSFLGAAAFGALVFSDESAILFGGVLGVSIAAAIIVIERTLGRLPAGSYLGITWIVATLLAWGLALGWAHDSWLGAAPEAGAPLPSRAFNRRRFLVRMAWLTGIPSVFTAVWAASAGRGRIAAGARWSDTHTLPNADALPAAVPGTRPEFTPLEHHYRVDVDTRPPRITAATWRLAIGGMVGRPTELTLDDLRREEPLHQFITLACISNPLGGDLVGTTRWSGISLQRLLDRVEVQSGATHLKVQSADGFFEFVSLETVRADPRVMLTYAWDGVPLTEEHGFPLRIYIPDVYGMKQPKWITGIDAVSQWEPGYWVLRGWDRDGRMSATSVVDTARFDATPGGNGRGTVVAGGIAHAGARGISRVEVRIDDAVWREASLRPPLSPTTWVVWRADVAADRKAQSLSVRCYDGGGAPQAAPFHRRSIAV